MKIEIPEFAIVALVGVSGSGKTTFAAKKFKKTEVISSDYCRGLVSDDENDQTATEDAFDLAYYIARKRMIRKKFTVIDATNIQEDSRKSILRLAREFHCLPVAIVLNPPRKVAESRNKERPDRNFSNHVLRVQLGQLSRTIKSLKNEGFRYIYHLKSESDIENVEIVKKRLWTDKTDVQGPFDIIGDIHGCYDELVSLAGKLGYQIDEQQLDKDVAAISHPDGRKLVLVGDLIDRGPKSPEVLKFAMNLVKHSGGFCVPGNHEAKLLKWIRGKKVQLKHGLQETINQLETIPDEIKKNMEDFIGSLVSHYVFDDGKLVVAHAGLKESMHGRASGAVRSFAMYGETSGETDEFGLPVRYNWAADYRGKAMVVYGHTPIPDAEWLNNTICIDTGCVFGGKLSALRYPERELVAVDAARQYYKPVKPLQPPAETLSMQQQHDELLDMNDIIGKKIISTGLRQNVIIRPENGMAAVEMISRFCVNPKWLIYLPPTMSPCEVSNKDEYLEYPTQAFNYYEKQGVNKVVVEEKHMGSRAVIVLCKNEEVAKDRFGIENEGIGICYSRRGRAFFTNKNFEQAVLARLESALNNSGFWEKNKTDWVALDTEIMPWSMKAMELLRQQYAAVGASGENSISIALEQLKKVDFDDKNRVAFEELITNVKEKEKNLEAFRIAYRQYCWNFSGIEDLKIAPFHILATEGKVHTDRDHVWHMESIKEICEHDKELLLATPYRIVNLDSEDKRQGCENWWLELTSRGGEGTVIKPFDFIAMNKNKPVQPAVKVRGREYLRIIYGPDYTLGPNIERLKSRGLSTKRSLAIREFALGLEGLERFVARKPLRFTHECAFGVLALESEPVDPRL